MRKAWTWILMLATVLASPCLAQDPSPTSQPNTPPASYEELHRLTVTAFQQEKYAEGVRLLLEAKARFPEKLMAVSYNLALMYGGLGEYEQGVQALREALEKGLWFSFWAFDSEHWKAYKELESFQKAVAESERRRLEAQQKAVMKLEVVTPEGYDPGKTYPLFIALHGGGETLAVFKPHWSSARLGKEFLVAFVQSTQVASMEGFHWQDMAMSEKDLREAYRQVSQQYRVDPAKVLIGGFSSGGYASLVVALKNLLPVAGFVALCPPYPEQVTPEDITQSKSRGLRGTLLSTERDHRLPKHRELAAALTAAGMDFQFVLFPNVGHWYPDDFSQRLDEAIGRILAPPPPGV